MPAGRPAATFRENSGGIRSDQQRPLFVDHAAHFDIAVHGENLRKGPSPGEPLGQLDGFRARVLVENGERVVFHLEGGRVGKHDQLQQHRQNQQHPALPIAEQRLQFLDDQDGDAMQHGSIECAPRPQGGEPEENDGCDGEEKHVRPQHGPDVSRLE